MVRALRTCVLRLRCHSVFHHHINRLLFDILQDLFFVVDIFLNFHTGMLEQGELIMDPQEIVSRYIRVCAGSAAAAPLCSHVLSSGFVLQGFFTLDLIATIPVDYISFLFGTDTSLLSASRALRVLRLARLLRLFRLARLFRYLGGWWSGGGWGAVW